MSSADSSAVTELAMAKQVKKVATLDSDSISQSNFPLSNDKKIHL